jgi:hypothetical protein
MTTTQITKPIKITPFIAVAAEGSEISDPTKDSGYDRDLAVELARVGNRGGTVYLSAPALDDLAEWLDAIYIGEVEGGSPAGARSVNKMREKARLYADLLRKQDQSTTNQEGATMAKVTRSKSSTKTAEKETKTTAAKSNGASTRRTAADWDSIVNEIRAKRQGGETMQALKKEYGVSSDVPLREALARAGFNSKGEALEYDDISGLSGAKLKARLVKERSEGTAWYMLALMTGQSESDLREVVGDTPIPKAAKPVKESAEGKEEGAQPKATAKRTVKKGTKANPSKTG